jgi:hypothetical protein
MLCGYKINEHAVAVVAWGRCLILLTEMFLTCNICIDFDEDNNCALCTECDYVY